MTQTEWQAGYTLINTTDGRSYIVVSVTDSELVVEGNTSTGARTVIRYTDKRPVFRRTVVVA